MSYIILFLFVSVLLARIIILFRLARDLCNISNNLHNSMVLCYIILFGFCKKIFFIQWLLPIMQNHLFLVNRYTITEINSFYLMQHDQNIHIYNSLYVQLYYDRSSRRRWFFLQYIANIYNIFCYRHSTWFSIKVFYLIFLICSYVWKWCGIHLNICSHCFCFRIFWWICSLGQGLNFPEDVYSLWITSSIFTSCISKNHIN